MRRWSPAALFFVIVAITTKLWAEASPLGIWLITTSTALIAAVDVFTDASPRVAAFFFGKALLMLIIMQAAGISLASVLAVFGTSAPPSVQLGIQCAIVGTVVGWLVRNSFLASYKNHRHGESAFAVRLHLAVACGLIVVLFPAADPVSGGAPLFVLGVSGGFLLHFWQRESDRRRLRRLRLKYQLNRSLVRTGTRPLHAFEALAISYFAGEHWHALRDLLRSHEGKFTLGLALVKATWERVRGQNREAIATLLSEVNREHRVSSPDDHLAYLLLAMCARELGDAEGAQEYLREADQRCGDCAMQMLFGVLLHAEALPAPGDPNWNGAAAIRMAVWRRLESAVVLLRTVSPRSPFADLVSVNIPLTRRFINDTYAYLLFKSDAIPPARALFDACLDDDSRSASTHLHLGEVFRALHNLSRDGDADTRRKADQWKRASDFCFWMAIVLSGDRDSHTKRRARAFLDKRGPGDPPKPCIGAAA